jgi:uncharacterized protein (TIGR03437 family)
MKLFLLVAAAVPLAAQCNYQFSPDPAVPLVAAAVTQTSGTITVTASPGCRWSYGSDSGPGQGGWISFSNGPTGGNGNGSFTWTAAPNLISTSPARQAKIYVFITNQVSGSGTIVFYVQQPAPTCSLALSGTGASAVVSGGIGSFQVTSNCQWNASATSWIKVSPGSGSGNGQLSYTVAANACVDKRSGQISVSESPVVQTFRIDQDGSTANMTLSPASASVGSAAADGRVVVTTGNGCGRAAASDVSWLHLSSTASGSGSGGVSYHADANAGPQPRVGHIFAGPAALTLTQQGVPAPAMQLTAITNSASGDSGPVSPGEIVSLWGTNLGPAAGAKLQLSPDGLSVTTTLGGVQVLFDGVPAPLTFVSGTQLNAVVPYGVAGTTKVQVSYQSAQSNVLQVPVQAATPAVYTFDASGHGGGALLNSDLTVNANANPARRGSVIVIYCTGGGAADPSAADGSVVASKPPFPALRLPVSVTVGGVASPEISYSGLAPGLVAGVIQINARIPDSVQPGANLLVVHIGDWQSQDRVTVAVQ